MRVGVIGTPTQTADLLVGAWLDAGLDARIVWPREALDLLLPGDVALARLDVLPDLDGIEPGLGVLARLERRGVRVLNRPVALLAAHDKLLSHELLAAAGIEQPETLHVEPGRPLPGSLPLPCVVKPRFGSWGRDVFLCPTRDDLVRCLDEVSDRSWWRRHGALVQALVAPRGHDLRVLVAGGRAVGSAARIPQPGEWRTNVSIGARLVHADAPGPARALAVAAAVAIGADFVSVDLLPLDGGHIVLELNGAADFDHRYAAAGENVWLASAVALGLAESPEDGSAPPPMPAPAGEGRIGRTKRREAAMVKTVQGKPAEVGDEITITGHAVGDAPRRAVILEVLGGAGHEHFRVRWEDGHESVYFPGGDAVIRRPERAAARPKAKARAAKA